jgi:predicted phosphodiesterase
MRIAAISDIHGNLGALDAVLADIGRRGVDVTVNLGDILSGALEPSATADRLIELDLPTLRGNHERQMLTGDREGMGPSDRFAAENITPRQRDWLTRLPSTLRLTPEVFMCHATPSSDTECYLEDIVDGEFVATSLAEVEARTGECDAPLILCGHSHIPRITQLSTGQLIVNPGSVGIQAYAGHHPIPHTLEMGSPHARYAIAESTPAGWRVDLIAVPYDWHAASRLAAAHGRADWALALATGFVRAALRPEH